jgi:hypothetical protein
MNCARLKTWSCLQTACAHRSARRHKVCRNYLKPYRNEGRVADKQTSKPTQVRVWSENSCKTLVHSSLKAKISRSDTKAVTTQSARSVPYDPLFQTISRLETRATFTWAALCGDSETASLRYHRITARTASNYPNHAYIMSPKRLVDKPKFGGWFIFRN